VEHVVVDVEVIGVSVQGPPPVGWVHLKLEPGVIALYGKNGVGKTRLLGAVADALTGVAREDRTGLVHLRTPDPEEIRNLPPDRDLTDWPAQLEAAAAAHLMESRAASIERIVRWRDEYFAREVDSDAPWEAIGEFGEELAREEYSPTSFAESVQAQVKLLRRDRQGVDDDPDAWAKLADELSTGGLITLRATGSRFQPSWVVYTSANSDMATARGVVADAHRQHQRTLKLMRAALAGEASEDVVRDLMDTPARHDQMGITFPWGGTLTFDSALFEGFATSIKEAVMAGLTPEPWPAWAPWPFVKVAEVESLPIRVLTENDAIDDVDGVTRSVLADAGGTELVDIIEGQEVNFSPPVTSLVRRVEDLSNEIVTRILQPAPGLRFARRTVDDWFLGRLPQWELSDDGKSWFELADASQAQARWVRLAISIATEQQRAKSRPVVLLADEPELGLHSQAQARLPRVLGALASDLKAVVVTTTHSPALLDSASAHPVHVMRIGAYAVVREIPPVGDEWDRGLAAERLGLTRSAMMQRIRTFVLVEGPHDRIVLEGLLGDALRDSDALVLPIGGAKQLPPMANAEWIWELTDAGVVVVLDGIASAAVIPIWDKARALAQKGDIEGAIRALQPLERMPGGEPKWLQTFLGDVARSGLWDRVTPAPLSEPDVICYLPPDQFVRDMTWNDILDRWRQAKRDRPGRQQPLNLKRFITGHLNGRASTKAIKDAVDVAVPTTEMIALAETIRSMSRRGSTPV
jgi:energy-coupling factor transporter ATP-binding protein EcfA2